MKAFACILATSLVLLLTGCSGSSGKSSGSGGAAKQANPNGADIARPGATAPPKAAPVRLSSQAMVYTASLRVRSGKVTEVANRAKQLVAAAGGYVGDENATSSPPSATLTLKIPSAKYTATLDQLGALGQEMSRQQQAQDVTQDVADVNSRVTSAKATLASFRDLLHKASGMSDILRLEKEISDRESDLESLQARQKALAQQTTYATVSMQVDGNGTVVSHKKKAHGFGHAMASGWHAFTAFLGGIAVFVGWTLPFLVLAAVIGIPLWYARRRLRPALLATPDSPPAPVTPPGDVPADPGPPPPA